MKTIKTIDVFIQLLLILGSIIYGCWPGTDGIYIIWCYIIVGSWQLLGFLIHASVELNLFFRKERYHYGHAVLKLLIGVVVSFLFEFIGVSVFLIYLYLLLIVTPILAIWYFTICVREVKLLSKKELVHLK